MKNYMQANRFLQKYGTDAFKIIAAYEEAADIPPNERYANWYGDYGIFEPSLNEDMTYDKLLSRYKVGLKYLGIIHEQTKAVCGISSRNSLQSISVSSSDGTMPTPNTVRHPL